MKITHPAFPEVTKDVKAYAAWRDAGWVVGDGKPAAPAPDPEKAPAPDQPEQPQDD